MKTLSASFLICKNLFKMDNARVLLLEVAEDYLNHSQLEEATDKQYGKGVTKMETKEIHTGTFVLGSIVI